MIYVGYIGIIHQTHKRVIALQRIIYSNSKLLKISYL